MKNKAPSRLTIMILPDAQRSVHSWRIPRNLLFWIPVLCVTVIAIIIFSYMYIHNKYELHIRKLNMMLRSNDSTLRQTITERDQYIHQLEQQLLFLADQSAEIELQIAQLQTLEHELRELTNFTPDNVQNKVQTASSTDYAPLSTEQSIDHFLDLSEHIRTSQINASHTLLQLSPTLQKHYDLIQEQLRRLEHTPSIWPVSSRQITSGFGYRQDPFSGSYHYHQGIDIDANTGDSVWATASGIVVQQDYDTQRGHFIVLEHDEGLLTVYMHLSKTLVSEGQQVKKGEKIGLVGSTGYSTGSHLHYEVHVNGNPVQPISYLKNSKNEEVSSVDG